MEFMGEYTPGHAYATGEEEMFDHEDEYGNEFEDEGESSYEQEGQYEGEGEQQEYHNGFARETGASSDREVMEMELATELLSVNNEEELEQFFGGLFKRIKGAAGKLLKSPAGDMLKGYLKSMAKKALPMASGVLGGIVGGPVGAAITSKASDMVGKALGLELEGLSPEDREFEIARGYVRYANDAIQRAASDRRYRYAPREVAKSAMINAARKHAPGFLSPNFFRHYKGIAGSRVGTGESGTWERQQDGSIILLGL